MQFDINNKSRPQWVVEELYGRLVWEQGIDMILKGEIEETKILEWLCGSISKSPISSIIFYSSWLVIIIQFEVESTILITMWSHKTSCKTLLGAST